MAGPSVSGGDAASIDDQSTEADTTGQRTRSKKAKNVVDAFEDIRSMADSLVLPKSIIDNASDIFKDVHDGKYLKGHGYHDIAAACLLIACRKEEGHSRTFKEICAVSKLTKKEIGRCFNLIRHALDISVAIIKISDFLPRFCLHLGKNCSKVNMRKQKN
jgi:transcription initiation factor TFIIB